MDGTGTAFKAGAPVELLIMRALNFPHAGGDYPTYAVSPDGQRFLYLQLMQNTAATPAQAGPDPSSGLVIAMHWAENLKK